MKWLSLLFVFIVLSSGLFAQGQIFSRQEADQLFGKVVKRVEVKKATLKLLRARCSKRMLLSISGSRAIITNEKKENLSSVSAETLSSESVSSYNAVSVAVMDQFLTTADETVYLEERESGIFSITSGEYTLERTFPCPPLCD